VIAQCFPAGPELAVRPLLRELTAEPEGGPLRVGDERIHTFLGDLSRRLLAPGLAKRHPELTALGFFLRRAELSRVLASVQDTEATLRFPRGVVFHLPPANVDTVFVYSWALSALAGNSNVVRLSSRSGPASTAILELLQDLAVHPAVARTQRLISYERSDEVTAELSAACDLRVIWGGDATVDAVRHHPLQPSARDLTFPDRSSCAAVSVRGWHAAEPGRRRRAADAFATDTYWFDQAACSSPRTIFWIGSSKTDGDAARTEFESLLAEAIAGRGFAVDSAMAVQKRTSAYGMAATGAADAIRFHGNALAAVDLTDPVRLPRQWLGAGMFAHASVGSLSDLVPLLGRRDQTLAAFGLTHDELHGFATELGGRGIDRIVPFGSALAFASVWDGYDLLREFTRLTTLMI
jgi:hypothetical protein